MLPRRPDDPQTDTDPSTPGALRGQDTEPTPTPAGLKVSTDPGIGPASHPPMPAVAPLQALPPLTPPPPLPPRPTPPPPPRPLGIVVPVPVSAPVSPKKDSVELLLDGITNPQPMRTKTTPQTDGQASASYHAEHVVQPARTSPDLEPSVVVDRPPQAKTIRVDRAKLQQVIAAADAYNARRRENENMEATAVLPQPMAPRVIVAVVAGLLVVLGIFLVARLSMNRASQAAAGASSKPVAMATIGTATTAVAAIPPPPPATPATATPTDSVPAPSPSAAPSPPVPTRPPWAAGPAGSGKQKPRSNAPGAAPTTGDLGEFKTKF